MHAVVPHVVAVRRNVHTLIIGVVATQTLIHRHPVLPCDECKSRRRTEVLTQYVMRHPTAHLLGRLALVAEHMIVELL